MFCSKCGKEVFDEAVVCPGCGCLLAENTKVKMVIKKDKQGLSLSIGSAHILLIISFVLMCVAGVFLWDSIVQAELYWGATRHVIPDNTATLIALICIICSVVMGALALIVAFFKKEKDWLILLTILNFIMTVSVLIMSIIGRAWAI